MQHSLPYPFDIKHKTSHIYMEQSLFCPVFILFFFFLIQFLNWKKKKDTHLKISHS